MNTLYKQLGELISIPSITRSNEEMEIVLYMEKLLQNIVSETNNTSGVQITIEKVEEKNDIYHGGIICHIKVSEKYNNIGLLGHLDVVPVVEKNWTKSPFCMTEEEDKIYGRGSCDMKAGITIMIEVLKESLKIEPNKNISLLFTSGEECGIPNGLTEILRSQKIGLLDFIIALEPTGGKINTGVFGYLDGEFHFEGKSCHSSNPSLGDNAIYKLIPLLEFLKDNKDITGNIEYQGEILDEAISATGIEGGIANNIIPSSSSIKINYRYSPIKKGYDIEQKFNKIWKEVGAKTFIIIEHNPASEIVTITNQMLIEFITKTKNDSKKALNIVPFWSDIAQTSKQGIPSINFGPGDIAQAHIDDEFIKKESFRETWEQFKNYLFT